MRLLKNYYDHVSHDTVREFEDTLTSEHIADVLDGYSRVYYKIWFFFFRVFLKFKINIIPRPLKIYTKNANLDSKHFFTIMMWTDGPKIMPYVLGSFHNKSIFLFDAWPDKYDDIVELCTFYKIDYLFITSVQSTARLQVKLPQTKVSYVPEAINVTEYSFRQYDKKDIDVLALGRHWDEHHDKIVNGLEKAGVRYLYANAGELIFPDRSSFIDGMARSKISICVPSNITHPRRSGDVETMTVRYLQSMASKCLILGVAPKEMVELFGYNPVITIDMADPVGQILKLLCQFNDYIPLVEKNYQTVIKSHTWRNRIQTMVDIWSLKNNGF